VSTATIRTMRPEDLSLALDWAAAEGWNPGLSDAACFLAADPDGFLLAELDGEPIGCVSAVRYGEGFGFLGFYIVRPAHRGRGPWHRAVAGSYGAAAAGGWSGSTAWWRSRRITAGRASAYSIATSALPPPRPACRTSPMRHRSSTPAPSPLTP
jgi:hypothetical protein